MNEHLRMYESPEDRIRRNARKLAAVGHPYASKAAVDALGTDVQRWSKQVQDRLDEWVTATNAALVAALEAQASEIAELQKWRAGLETYLGEFFSGTDGRLLTLEAILQENGLERPKRGAENLGDRIRTLEARADQQDRDAAERRERS